MRRHAFLLGLVLLAVPAPASAQSCSPPSAEHAFEEFLAAAADDSPAEADAWIVADRQEAKNAFESPETIRLLTDLATREGLKFDCGTRTYRPVGGGLTPAEAELEEDSSPETATPGVPPAGSGGEPTQPATAGSDGDPAANGGSTPGALRDPGAAEDGAILDGSFVADDDPAGPRVEGRQGTKTRTGGQPPGEAGDASPPGGADGSIPFPDEVAGGPGATAATVGDRADEGDRSVLRWVGAMVAISLGACTVAGLRSSRRRQALLDQA